eukprot:8762878-Pyramimonas_sp.AAC.1
MTPIWCDLLGASCMVQSMWCPSRGAIDVSQPMQGNSCVSISSGAINAVQPIWCELCGVGYEVIYDAQPCKAVRGSAKQCRATPSNATQ